MIHWKRVCCAIDFSDESRLAMANAAHLAQCLGAELQLVHVSPPPRPSMVARDLLAPHPEELKASIVSELEGVMAEWKSDAERLARRPVQASVVIGDAAEEIVRFAREQAADAVVLATHGRTGLKRALLGSVAEQVVRHAPCPVLVVRAAPSQAQARPSAPAKAVSAAP